MKTDSINAAILPTVTPGGSQVEDNASSNNGSPGFMEMLSAALQDVSTSQQAASQSSTDLVLGEESYLHNTMIAYEKANLSLQLVLEVRNRLVEAFQEIMRIQV